MATVSGGTTIGLNFDTLEASELFNYDSETLATTAAKYFDDPSNYTLFKGSGFTYNSSGLPTSGFITALYVVVDGETVLKVTGINNVSATDVVAFASSGDTAGLLNVVFAGADAMTGTSLVDVLNGFGGNDILAGGNGNDRLSGGIGNETMQGGLGKDVIDGGTGVDSALYTDKTAAVVVTLNGATNASVAIGGVTEDALRNVENVTGGTAADILTGDGFANTLSGGAGNDRLAGGDGNDTLIGGVGKDVIDGGTGIDTASYAEKTVAVVVTLNGATNASVTVDGLAEDALRNIENVTGGSVADVLTGDGLANTFIGGAGDDTLIGGGGGDRFVGGSGNDNMDGGTGKDTVDYGSEAQAAGTKGVVVNLLGQGSQGGLTADTAIDSFGDTDHVANIPNVVGTSFSDKIYGGKHDNVLSGGAGNDLIDGERGIDTLTGGSGKDIFVFHTALGNGNVDTITDFNIADDTIRLDNAVFTALSATGALASGFFRASATGTAQDANDFIVYETDTGKLFYDADGNGAGAARHFATLTGTSVLTAADFVVI